MLKPGGDLFMSTLNRNAAAFIIAILGAEYVARVIPRGTHQYDRFIRPSELCRWLRASGMRVRDVSGIRYNPLGRTARTGGSPLVNYMLHATRGEDV
jgi:2-polyprenyl-6-hydroxyphenyl methylase/3-demethylubiquinone-9 3-methyltransferase